MSTENEGNEGNAAEAAPSVRSAPPVPADAPQGLPPSAPDAPPHPDATTTQHQAASPAQDPATTPMAPVPPAAPQYAPPAAPQSAADAGWPPPPPAVPSYAHGAQGGGPVWGAPAQPQAPDAPRKRGAGGLVAAVVVAALVAGGVGGALGFWAADSNNDSGSSGSTTVAASGTPQDLKRDPGTVAGVAAKALPSVVTIDAQGGDGEGGTGTGFVYDKEGHILTNNHVVASAADSGQLTATFSNGKKYDAEVVGRAQGYDVAVLKLKNPPQGLTPLPLGNSDQVAVGDSTIAIGAPFGLSNTVTTGIISAKNRPVASGDGSGGSNSYMSALQTDASINPGNSGGPLLSAGGAVIGINSAIQSTGSTGQSQAGSIGLGFAIPVNQAKNVAQQLIKTGQPVYPVIGATVTMDEKTGGAVISDQGAGGTEAVTKDGPAARAGLRAGDVITKFNDTVVDSGPTLIGEIWTHKPGDKVTLTYKRDGKTSTAEVTLGERKGDS
ncbi:trypsin-like peptidase domain-containing protein [Streptomyces sp. P01-B04]|uniref:Trypsin-like peptidase domain-containing protein n=1 Tax=Streptomyces poriferorum TaxID=2798799 RepID=A0ABY9IS71_9ACTN|nr:MULTISPECIES: trypsin-like peptidase domain-containing protein [Streptomyces]MBW5252617.1 trypsin-like peptidase domain-containing protein [Streptomyces poriferorum]MBW5259469.1 trypsin-like peptidase domain-containing protein [Streptomyces poriferorum]MDP5313364.1 trypsin-like peptidase domain-containing protein [Streptomyces sp. Alt4]WLQ57654.1 trypsin-like peptidase domain-containing protein [Streptomyces sp. Alt2]